MIRVAQGERVGQMSPHDFGCFMRGVIDGKISIMEGKRWTMPGPKEKGPFSGQTPPEDGDE